MLSFCCSLNVLKFYFDFIIDNVSECIVLLQFLGVIPSGIANERKGDINVTTFGIKDISKEDILYKLNFTGENINYNTLIPDFIKKSENRCFIIY